MHQLKRLDLAVASLGLLTTSFASVDPGRSSVAVSSSIDPTLGQVTELPEFPTLVGPVVDRLVPPISDLVPIPENRVSPEAMERARQFLQKTLGDSFPANFHLDLKLCYFLPARELDGAKVNHVSFSANPEHQVDGAVTRLRVRVVDRTGETRLLDPLPKDANGQLVFPEIGLVRATELAQRYGAWGWHRSFKFSKAELKSNNDGWFWELTCVEDIRTGAKPAADNKHLVRVNAKDGDVDVIGEYTCRYVAVTHDLWSAASVRSLDQEAKLKWAGEAVSVLKKRFGSEFVGQNFRPRPEEAKLSYMERIEQWDIQQPIEKYEVPFDYLVHHKLGIEQPVWVELYSHTIMAGVEGVATTKRDAVIVPLLDAKSAFEVAWQAIARSGSYISENSRRVAIERNTEPQYSWESNAWSVQLPLASNYDDPRVYHVELDASSGDIREFRFSPKGP